MSGHFYKILIVNVLSKKKLKKMSEPERKVFGFGQQIEK